MAWEEPTAYFATFLFLLLMLDEDNKEEASDAYSFQSCWQHDALYIVILIWQLTGEENKEK